MTVAVPFPYPCQRFQTDDPEVIRPGRRNEDRPPENLLVKWSSVGEVALAADSICQPCVCSDTYGSLPALHLAGPGLGPSHGLDVFLRVAAIFVIEMHRGNPLVFYYLAANLDAASRSGMRHHEFGSGPS